MMHTWAFEISERCDMMRCGLIIHLRQDLSIIGGHDFVDHTDGVDCCGCLKTVRQPHAEMEATP